MNATPAPQPSSQKRSQRPAAPTKSDVALRDFVLLTRLTVGPPKIEPRRIIVPYEVVRDGVSATTELIYRYQEQVFDPRSAADRNLAALIGCQVAINYGLFAQQIVLRGSFDEHDQRFILDAFENTAREIAVHKIFHHNPFLRPDFQGAEAVPHEKYCAARVTFESEAGEDLAKASASPTTPVQAEPWQTDQQRVCVLSSGGKESLLGYGLLEEMGYQAHPIFINESGRHWFTALNAYRHFDRHIPETSKVWTNCDRVFAWMLRQLPCIRPNFQSLRSDEYPVRLWTVAVFLFGALPLLRKRDIGRLVIGDEYDTTVRTTHNGITHYGGLYDQSRFFDRGMTRYFRRKGFNIEQFSMLRSLSELLVEKTLAERYPQLLALQVSCHATSSDRFLVRPCGRCEKCRRVVGMLLALGVEPAVCQYDSAQIDRARESLLEHGVHQERAAAAHLGHLLHEAGMIDAPRLGSVAASPANEITRLRFHRDRSSVDDIPADMRAPLFTKLLEHAEGASIRENGVWADFSPPTEGEQTLMTAARLHRRTAERSALWGELNWRQAEQRLKETDIALLPVGAIEQHGHHLPLDVDSFDAEYLARAVACGCSDPAPLVLPLIPYGVSYHHDNFPGTVSISNETMAKLCHEVGMAAAHNGIKKLVIINGHGGNSASLHFAAQTINRDARIFTCVDSGETSDSDVERLAVTDNDLHAGEIETSTTMALRPALVRLDRAQPELQEFASEYLNASSERGLGWYAHTDRLSETGAMGDPTMANREKGEQMWEAMIHHLVELVEHIKHQTLEQLYERKT